MPPLNKFGSWREDGDGLPAYAYTGGYPVRALDRRGRDAQLPDDPCFLLGNYRLTLFVHASGHYQFITGERGWARANHGGQNRGWSRTQLHVENGRGEVAIHTLAGGDDGPTLAAEQQTFGVGYARSIFRCPAGLSVTRTLAVKPSVGLHQGNPAFLVAATLANGGPDPISTVYREEVLARYVMMNDQGIAPANRRVEYVNRLDVDPARHRATADFGFHPLKLFLPPKSPGDQFTHDIAPPLLFLSAEPPGADGTHRRVETRREEGVGDLLCGEASLTIPPGESRTVRFVVGLSFERGDDLLDQQIAGLLAPVQLRDDTGPFSEQWAGVLPDLATEPDPVLRREMLWNAYTLEAMATYSQYFRETFVPQGSVYAYHQGMNGSNRDHLQHALPLMFTNPPLAKSCLRHAMKHCLHDGEIRRQNDGFGYCAPGIYMESDPQLYMFMAVGEYLRVTGDHAFLDEAVEYYPLESGRADPVLTFLAKQFIYLRDVVGTGKHGLVKMLNSDWSDSFFHRLSPNIYWLFAESHMNSAMALAVLPPLIRELRRAADGQVRESALAHELARGMSDYHDAIHDAVMRDLDGRTFAPRCYVGEHDEPALYFGVDRLCLEAQPFLLQAETFPVERKRQLFQEIRARVLDMEKMGARTREVPINDPEGKGEDGGIWWAHQGFLMVGLATFDREAALRLMRRLTFAAFAENYPDYWLGHWTFADSLESTLSPREGLYAFWLPGAFQPFCAHAHAWMLYGYFKVVRRHPAGGAPALQAEG